MNETNTIICEWCEDDSDSVCEHEIEEVNGKIKPVLCLGCYEMYNDQMAYDRAS
jgi:hypothetical protein